MGVLNSVKFDNCFEKFFFITNSLPHIIQSWMAWQRLKNFAQKIGTSKVKTFSVASLFFATCNALTVPHQPASYSLFLKKTYIVLPQWPVHDIYKTCVLEIHASNIIWQTAKKNQNRCILCHSPKLAQPSGFKMQSPRNGITAIWESGESYRLKLDNCICGCKLLWPCTFLVMLPPAQKPQPHHRVQVFCRERRHHQSHQYWLSHLAAQKRTWRLCSSLNCKGLM